jgi:ketosteroid isomerase-like protein
MLRALTLVVGGLLVGGTVLSAQDAVSEIRKTLDAQRAAAVAKDAKAYERFLADDLRWVNADGTLNNKQDRLKGIPTPATPPPTLGEVDIRVSGDWATVVGISTSSNGSRSRHARTYVKRDGRWQLVLLASVPMK